MKNDSVIIKSSNGFAELQFSERNGLFLSDGSEFYRVTIKNKDIVASSNIYAFQPYGESCRDYFENLATNWRGWNGVKRWNSLEGEFTISSESDTLGHIAMEIMLKSQSDWSAQINIDIDAGQLEDITLQIKQFFVIEKFDS